MLNVIMLSVAMPNVVMLSVMMLGILSIKGLFETLSIGDTQYNNRLYQVFLC